MAILTTKYSIGDKVFCARTVTERKKHPCPDCKGSREWRAMSPAGGEYTFGCPRCAAQYNSDRDMTLDYSAHVPSVSCLTIGSIQVNTEKGAYDEGARYMCVETGIGSGSVYNESDLFNTEEEARSEAQTRADSLNSTVEWIATLYNKTLSISDYQLENAALKLAADEKSNARSMLYNLGYLFDSIKEAADKDAILEAIDDYTKYDWARDKKAAAPSTLPLAEA